MDKFRKYVCLGSMLGIIITIPAVGLVAYMHPELGSMRDNWFMPVATCLLWLLGDALFGWVYPNYKEYGKRLGRTHPMHDPSVAVSVTLMFLPTASALFIIVMYCVEFKVL